MAEEAERAEPMGRRFRTFLRAQRLPLSIVVLAGGLVMTALALGYFTPLNTDPTFQQINGVTAPSGGSNYNLIFVVAGPIVSIIGGYFVGAYYLARRRFEHLMVTKSKAEFLRNLPEVEDLLWELTPNDELRYSEKKSELRIRR